LEELTSELETNPGLEPERHELIGRYKILQKLGEGGCGVVYMAEQQEPVKRRVALKVIKLGMDTRQVVARFEAERQALALMDHPNIAKVLDGGATQTGRPYFVMELVRGVPITRYCDENKLDTRQRLNLFIQVCQAVQHAHQKGIIHRDVKPSNILVADHDGVPVPKVIDFGIAKATAGQTLTDKTLFTAFEQFIGTPAYMSPEQAKLSGLDIDTRTDIYSLGVLLYELLTGKTPFDAKRLMQAGFEEICRIIREEEPPRPSTKLSTLDVPERTAVANQRHSDPPKLAGLIRGDLDWIVMKTLEKDRNRRYETANGLAMDLQHFLREEPVVARPPSSLYRFQKLVRRNKLAVAAAGCIIAALILGIAVSTWQAIRATRSEREQGRLHLEALKAKAEAEANGVRLAESLTKLEIQRAEELFTAGDASTALAYLARVLRQDPTNRVAAERVVSALTQRDFALPISEPLQHKGDVAFAEFSPNGLLVLTACGACRIWDAATGRQLLELDHGAASEFASGLDCAHFSPDGTKVVTVQSGLNSPFAPATGKDVLPAAVKTARIWSSKTGEALKVLKHDDWVRSAKFSRDGRKVVTASNDGTARVWDVETGRFLVELKHRAVVMSAEFSLDGKRVLTASQDRTARLWDANSGAVLIELKHKDIVRSARFSPDDRRILTLAGQEGLDSAGTGTVRAWDANTGEQVAELNHADAVSSAQFSPDGQWILTACKDGTAAVWDLRTNHHRLELKHDTAVWLADFSPDGLRVVTVSRRIVRVWDANSGQLVIEPIKHGDSVWSASFSPDGRRLLTASGDRTAQVLDVSRGPGLAESVRHGALVRTARFSKDGTRIVTASEDTTARVWDARTGLPLIRPLKHSGEVISAEFSPDGQRVITAGNDSNAYIWNAKTGEPTTGPLRHTGSYVWCAEFSPDGKRVVTVTDDVFIWDASTGRLQIELKNEKSAIAPGPAHFSPDGTKVVTSCFSWTRVWNAVTGHPLIDPIHHDGIFNKACFSPDGRRLLTMSSDGTARVWDAKTGRPLLTKPLQHAGQVGLGQFSPDGQRVVTAASDYTARVWDAKTGEPVTEPLRHEDYVHSAQFSPDGKRIVTASLDKTARLWDASTGVALAEPFKHTAGVEYAEFSPDGQQVVTTCLDGVVRLWHLPSLPSPAPSWLCRLVEAVGGNRLNDNGALEQVPFSELQALRTQLAASPASDLWARWAKWFFGDPATRTISPFSDTTVAQYVELRLEEGTLEGAMESARLSLANGVGMARAVQGMFAGSTGDYSTWIPAADWYSRRALEIAQGAAETWCARAEVLGHQASFPEALNAIETSLKIDPRKPELWNTQGRLLEKASRLDESYKSLTRAIELADAKPGSVTKAQSRLFLDRSNFLRKQGREAEAAQDFCFAKNIPVRDLHAPRGLIDLSGFYNAALTENWHNRRNEGNDLSELAQGLQTLAGIQFDVRGIVQLSGQALKTVEPEYPQSVSGILVGQRCRRIHWLQATGWGVPDGLQVGSYIIHYADGQQREIPIVYGKDIRDWLGDQQSELDRASTAWKGTRRLVKSTWENPMPQTEIATIDFTSTMTAAAPFLIAITVEQ
jgi:WD40 repeat protein/tRNA A-37 threonylcarbamoyl transferase component Bud32/tetratricopeptide (TPR) repeat protein